MSRKMLAIAAVAILALPFTAAHSQLGFGIAAGLTQPSGNLGDGVDAGYHVMGILSISPPLAPVGFRIDGMFNEFKFKTGPGVTADTKYRIMAVTGNAVVGVPGMIVVSPYAIGGIGMYNATISPKPTGFESETNLGFNIGAGIKFGLAGFSAFGEARYHFISGKDAAGNQRPRFIPVTFGVTF